LPTENKAKNVTAFGRWTFVGKALREVIRSSPWLPERGEAGMSLLTELCIWCHEKTRALGHILSRVLEIDPVLSAGGLQGELNSTFEAKAAIQS
jgi:hypothetical protein